ncbi:MAG: BTAD domain-containing putative transcriptional regulator [Candidatus Sericytochromatia bacterium]|nr:BTAD domain-containing putative transcriptional regulator [Candidatus Sericytochromatia bacterium]
MTTLWPTSQTFAAPPPPPGTLARALLPAEAPLPPVVVLAAGPGYGKTVALQALAQRHPEALGVWLSLDPFDADPGAFFTRLLDGMRSHIPDFGQELEPLLLSGQAEPRLLTLRFLQAVAAYNLPGLTLALDDWHHVQEGHPGLAATIVAAFERLPPGMRLLLATRKRLEAPLARLRTRGLVALLGPDELRFSPAEAEALVRVRAGLGDGELPASWRTQLERLDGWPLGLGLLAASTGEAPRFDQVSGGLEGLTAYVAEECWHAQPPDRQAFMLRASVLHTLTEEALRAVLDEPAPAERLAELETHLLINRAGEGWRFPAHLAAFVQAEAARVLPPTERASRHERAAAYHAAHGDDELALPHWLALADWPAAVAACNRVFPGLMLYGRAGAVARWLEAIPAPVVAAEPWLQLWRGHVLIRQGAQVEAEAAYERARAGFEAGAEAAGAFKVGVRQATLAMFAGHWARFDGLVEALLGQRGSARPEDLADLELVRGVASEGRGNLAQMRACNEAVLTLPAEGNAEVAACQATALMNLHTLALYQGELDAARRHADRAIALAEQWRFLAYRQFLTFLRANVALLTGESSEADGLLRGLPPTWADALDFHERGIAHTVLGRWRTARGEWREAEAELSRAFATFDEAGHAEGRKVALEPQLWMHLARQQPQRVEALIAALGELDGTSIHDLALMVPWARALLARDAPAEALAVLGRALPELLAQGAALHLARGRRIEAACARRLGAAGRAEAALAEALAIAARQGYAFLAGEDPGLGAELAGPGQAPAAPAAPAAGATLTVRCLGGFEVRLNGVRLDAELRRKPRLVLAALAVTPRGLRAADLAAALGARTFTAGSQKALQGDIVELRRGLEPGLTRGQDSRFVRFQDDRYVLDWSAVAPTDLALLEGALAEAERLAASQATGAAEAYTRALALYPGPLLPDGFFLDHFHVERDGLTARVTRAMSWLVQHHREQGELAQAEGWLTRAISASPCDEELYVMQLRLHVLSGRLERLRQVYWDCRKALKAHLGVAPSEAFEEAFQGIAGMVAAPVVGRQAGSRRR